jgi:RNA 2',3'-cyclic 3'-phosphodiesterase
MTKRLFLGIKIEASDALNELKAYLNQELRNSDIKWVSSDNYHITLKFFGDTNSELIPEIVGRTKMITNNFNVFEVKLTQIGRFGRKNQTNVIWLGIDDSGVLTEIAGKINHSMKGLVFADDKQKFNPHLTLGRVISGCEELKLQEIINSDHGKNIQSSTIRQIILYESCLHSRGTKYLPIELFGLSG